MNYAEAQTILFAEKHYSEKKFKHALRVASYAYNKSGEMRLPPNQIIPDDERSCVFILGILHDIVEDTNVTIDEVKDFIRSIPIDTEMGKKVIMNLEFLTHYENQSYEDYMRAIVDRPLSHLWAWVVKAADMKDHFAQSTTLTEKLYEKYRPWVHYFL